MYFSGQFTYKTIKTENKNYYEKENCCRKLEDEHNPE